MAKKGKKNSNLLAPKKGAGVTPVEETPAVDPVESPEGPVTPVVPVVEQKKEKPAAKKDVEPKGKLPIEVFYARFLNFNFVYPVVTPEGKKATMTNRVTGIELTDDNGLPRYITKMEAFETKVNRMSKGYLSRAVHDPNDTSPQNVARGEALVALSIQSDIAVYTESDHERLSNLPMWSEKQKRKELEKKASRVDELEARLAELEG